MDAGNIIQFPDRRGSTRYASRRACTLRLRSVDHTVLLSNISVAGAFIKTGCLLRINDVVTLRHPDAGDITARVVRIAVGGAALAFAHSEQSATFALSAMCADMTIRADAAATGV